MSKQLINDKWSSRVKEFYAKNSIQFNGQGKLIYLQ